MGGYEDELGGDRVLMWGGCCGYKCDKGCGC